MDKKLALMNDVILQNVFKFCSPKTLAVVRLVSKKWYKVSLQTWRNNTCIIQWNEMLENWDNELLQLWKYPYKRFKVDELLSDISESSFWLPTLLNMQRYTIQQLEICMCTFYSCDTIIFVLFGDLPNLTTLKFFNNTVLPQVFNDYSRSKPCFRLHPNLSTLVLGIHGNGLPFTNNGFIKPFSNIKNLHLLNCGDETPFNYSGILLAVASAREQHADKFRLQILDTIGMDCDARQEISFAVSELISTFDGSSDLKCLTIDLGNISLDVAFRSLLIKIGGSLRHLYAFRNSTGFNAQRVFQSPLLHLASLRITEHVFSDMSFMKFLPNLNVLIIEHMDCKHQRIASNRMQQLDRGFMKGFCNQRMKEFCFGRVCDQSELMILSKWMPCLKKIYFPVNNQLNYETILLAFKMLSELTFYPLHNINVTKPELRGTKIRVVVSKSLLYKKCIRRSIFSQVFQETLGTYELNDYP